MYQNNVPAIEFETIENTQTLEIYTNPFDIVIDNQMMQGKGFFKEQNQKIKIEFVNFNVDQKVSQLQQTDCIMKVHGKFEEFENNRNFNVFDYGEYAKKQNMVGKFKIDKIEYISINNDLYSKYNYYRIKILSKYKELEKYDWVGLHNTLLLNLKSPFYNKVKEDMIQFGIIHFFAISGYHINIIIKYLSYILRRVGTNIRKIPYILSGLLLFYGYIIRWPIGALRAITSYIFNQMTKKFKWNFSPMDQISIIAIALMLLDPLIINNIGFIFSFLMTIIIKFWNQMTVKSKANNAILTILCLLFSWPLSINISFCWNPFQCLTIMLASKVFEVFIMPSMFITTIGIILLPQFVIWWSLNLQNNEIISSVYILINKIFSVGNICTGKISEFWQIILIITAIYFMFKCKTNIRCGIRVAIIIYSIFTLWVFHPRFSSEILIIDVGQGDSLLYKPQNSNKFWLIDTGGKRNMTASQNNIDTKFAYRNIIPTLKAEGVNDIEGIIITHSDLDHIGNLVELSKNFTVKNIVINQETANSQIWKIIQPLINKKTQVHILMPENSYLIPKRKITLYYLDAKDNNDSSIIVEINLGKYNFLNMGDLSQGGERKLLQAFPQIQSDLLKLGHHGSKTSTSKELLDYLEPKICFISAGVNNLYHHPHQEVVKLLNDYQIPMVATKDRGAIRIKYIPGKNLYLDTKFK